MRAGALILVLCGLGLAGVAFGQSAPPAAPTQAGGNVAAPVSLLSNREFVLTLAIIAFGIIVIFFQYILLRSVVENKTAEISKTFIVSLIIIGTLALITSGFTNEQIAPALGLFGTIAGYLLGRSERRSPGRRDDEG